ncbi:hypothetical protein TNCV_1764911 [Trichonephila clavipes]|nr:hypothetical protein TNCV_1764911 [Trichonephila clavipes]
MNHCTTDSLSYASFGVRSYHSTPFAAEWNVRKAFIASFALDRKPYAFVPPQLCDERWTWITEWNTLCLLTNPASACNITMVGLEFGDTVVRGCWTVALCFPTLVLHSVSWFGLVLDLTVAPLWYTLPVQ